MPNAFFHTGDNHVLLPRGSRRFVHSAEGVMADVRDVLAAGVLDGVMILHDAMNPEVRRGVKAARIELHPNVRYLDLDFVPGHMWKPGTKLAGEIWGGLGLAIVSDSDPHQLVRAYAPGGVEQGLFVSPQALARPASEVIGLPSRIRGLPRRAARTLPEPAKNVLRSARRQWQERSGRTDGP